MSGETGPESKANKEKKGSLFQQTLPDLHVIFTINSKTGPQVELFRLQLSILENILKKEKGGEERETKRERGEKEGEREKKNIPARVIFQLFSN